MLFVYYSLALKRGPARSGCPGLARVSSSSSNLKSVCVESYTAAAQVAHANKLLHSRWLLGILCEEEFILWAWVRSLRKIPHFIMSFKSVWAND